jgi:hypothetical protein
MGEPKVFTEYIETETIVVENSTDTESAGSGGDTGQTTGGSTDGEGEGDDIKYHE